MADRSCAVLPLLLLIPLAGCASMIDGVNQTVTVKTEWAGRPVSGAFCTLTNDRGQWFVRTPGSVAVKGSNSPMNVECTKPGVATNMGTVQSHTRFITFADPVFGLLVGTLVDVGNGAAFRYPNEITVTMVPQASPSQRLMTSRGSN